jgi:molecular chaperone GrpE (heat shock protein)
VRLPAITITAIPAPLEHDEMDEDETPPPRGGVRGGSWQNSPEYLRERIENLERQLREAKSQNETRVREMAADYDRRIREAADVHAKATKEVEEAADKRISKIETSILTGLGLVATLFVGALFTLIAGGGGPGMGG